jgi:hypothetical protein
MTLPAGQHWTLPRSQSPWYDFTATAQEEQAGFLVAAVALGEIWGQTGGTHLQAHEPLAEFHTEARPWLAIDPRGRRVVVDAARFGDLQRPDATRLQPGESVAMGQVRDPELLKNPQRLGEFLLRSHLIETVAHLHAEVALQHMADQGGVLQLDYRGHHVYFTSERCVRPLAFALQIDVASGALVVCGLPAQA